jgi:hypothetical protein
MFRGTERRRSERSFWVNVAPTPFAWFETFHPLAGCSLWTTPIASLTNSIFRWIAPTRYHKISHNPVAIDPDRRRSLFF